MKKTQTNIEDIAIGEAIAVGPSIQGGGGNQLIEPMQYAGFTP
jgi:hypothetical protein